MILKLLSPDELDLGAYAEMQRQSFFDLLQQSGVPDDFISAKHFQWKYSPPAGKARIAVAFEDGEMVASYAMLPLRVGVRGRELSAWQACDGATLPRARGKGYFIQCVERLNSALDPGEIVFGFPNRNSKPVFDKIGWRNTQTVTTFARAVPFAWRPADDGEVIELDPARSSFSAPAVPSGRPTLVRDAQYVSWRYLQHPSRPYTVCVHRTSDGAKGYVVLREAALGGRRVVLLMELHASSASIEGALVRRAARWSFQRRIRCMVMVSNYFTAWTGLKRGFMVIPPVLLPKRQVLMGSGTTRETDELMREEWLVQTGDWDGF